MVDAIENPGYFGTRVAALSTLGEIIVFNGTNTGSETRKRKGTPMRRCVIDLADLGTKEKTTKNRRVRWLLCLIRAGSAK